MSTTVPSRPASGRLAAALPILGSLAIAVGLIAVSYGHIFAFAEKAGASWWEAAILAATVDGAIVVALAVIGLAKARGQEPPKIAKVTLIVAVVATGAANLDHGVGHGWRGVAAAVWVPLVAELAYLLAMATGRITRSSSAATGGRSVEEDGRRVICTRVVATATVAATMPPRVRPVVAICGGHLIGVATVVRPLADLRPAICGGHVPLAAVSAPERPADLRRVICSPVIPAADVAMPADVRPVICGHLVAIADVAMPEPLADLRPVICTAPVTVAEVMARTSVAIPAPVATEETPAPAPRPRSASRPVATAEDVAAREMAILEWVAEAADPDARMAAARGPEVATVLAAAGHPVSARTARRDLQAVRDQLATVAA